MLRHRLSTLLAVPILLLASIGFSDPAVAATPTPTTDSAAIFETKMALRDLWVEHAFWIRSYVLASKAGDTEQRKVAETEVVKNAGALAATIAPYYGQPAADGLLKLLAGHWAAVRDYDAAATTGSRSACDTATLALAANAHEIAKYLSTANPYLPEATVFSLLSAHGAHHVAQINQVMSGDFKGEAQTWQAMRKHMLVIADAIATGLAKQFPDKF